MIRQAIIFLLAGTFSANAANVPQDAEKIVVEYQQQKLAGEQRAKQDLIDVLVSLHQKYIDAKDDAKADYIQQEIQRVSKMEPNEALKPKPGTDVKPGMLKLEPLVGTWVHVADHNATTIKIMKDFTALKTDTHDPANKDWQRINIIPLSSKSFSFCSRPDNQLWGTVQIIDDESFSMQQGGKDAIFKRVK